MTKHPELLAPYHQALSLYAWLQAHPEVETAAVEFYGDRLVKELSRAACDLAHGVYDPAGLLIMIGKWQARLSPFAAPRGNWN